MRKVTDEYHSSKPYKGILIWLVVETKARKKTEYGYRMAAAYCNAENRRTKRHALAR